jgi:hypothetical protein
MLNFKALVGACALLVCITPSFAVPTLQLDIPGGVYKTTDDTTYATSAHFDLVALLNGTLDVNRTYYISAVIEPKISLTEPAPNFGSFSLGGQVFSLDNMHAGAPPLGASKTISPHDEYPSYFTEFQFHFDAAHTVSAYDVQTGKAADGSLYAYSLAVDTSPLAAGYSVHFDLYDIKVGKDLTIDDIAPFSHDAQSMTSGGQQQTFSNRVPDSGTTLVLLAIGLVGIAAVPRLQLARARRRR